MNLKKKEEIIEYLKLNYTIILSYGSKGLVPIGKFEVVDIIVDEIPEEYSDMITEQSTARVVLKNSKNEEQQIVMPFNKFISVCLKNAEKNASILNTGIETSVQPEDVVERVEHMLIEDEFLAMGNEMFDKLELVDLEDSEVYLSSDDTEDKYLNLFVCPIDLGKWRERILEKEEYLKIIKRNQDENNREIEIER